MKTVNSKRAIVMIAMIAFCCNLLFCALVYAAEDSQEKSDVVKAPIVIPTPSPAFYNAVLDEAFSEFVTGYHIYISIKIQPSFYPPSQMVLRLKAGEDRAQVSYKQAAVTVEEAFSSAGQLSSDVKTVAGLMGVRQKDIIIPEDVVLKWISNYWANLEAAVRQIRDKDPNKVSLDGIRYIIEIYTYPHRITLQFMGTDLQEKNRTDLDIKSMLDWIAPIVEYVKKASSGDEKQ